MGQALYGCGLKGLQLDGARFDNPLTLTLEAESIWQVSGTRQCFQITGEHGEYGYPDTFDQTDFSGATFRFISTIGHIAYRLHEAHNVDREPA